MTRYGIPSFVALRTRSLCVVALEGEKVGLGQGHQH